KTPAQPSIMAKKHCWPGCSPNWKALSNCRVSAMTKIQLSFTVSVPLDDQLMARVAEAYGTYGILRIDAERGEKRLTVEYDATRFSPKDVESALAGLGFPLAQRSI